MSATSRIVILMADDDPDDRLLARDALRESPLDIDLRFACDGRELLDYLRREGRWAAEPAPRPGIILLDLNMPRMDGREALAEIKRDPELRRIPVIVMTTSRARDDVHHSYDMGAASYISKPITFEGLVDVMRELGRYWAEVVALPV